jgi:hypothetical protein
LADEVLWKPNWSFKEFVFVAVEFGASVCSPVLMGALSNFAVAELRTGKPSTVRIMRFHYAESHSLDTCLLFDPFSVVILGSRFSADSCYCSARVYGALASPFCIPDLSWGHVKPTISALERQRQLQAFMIEVYFHWSPFASELPLGLTALHLQ